MYIKFLTKDIKMAMVILYTNYHIDTEEYLYNDVFHIILS